MSAFTITSNKQVTNYSTDGVSMHNVRATGPSSYDTGGSVIDLSVIAGGNPIRTIIGLCEGTTGRVCHYVPDTSDAAATCKLVVDDGGTQISGSTDLSAVVFDLIVFVQN